MSINITKQTSYSNTSAYSNRPLDYIVIHYTAGSTSKAGAAYNNAVRFSNPSVGASADFIVDDTTAVQYNPDIKNRYCWHCGDGKNPYSKGGSYYGKCTNANSIGIEVCCTNPKWKRTTPPNSPDWSFTEAVVNKAVDLTEYLMQTYNIPASNVIRHYDVSGKLCPGVIGWNAESKSEAKWQAFKAKLGSTAATAQTNTAQTATKTTNTTKNTTTKTPFKVRVKITNLRIRSGAGTNYASKGYISKGVYTITQTKSAGGYTWGKLKSGAGWIALDYTEKV